jgi:hypothetical protein
MLYRVHSKDIFKPITIELTLQTEEEFDYFYENVMTRLTKMSECCLHDDVYNCRAGKITEAHGTI